MIQGSFFKVVISFLVPVIVWKRIIAKVGKLNLRKPLFS